MRTRETLGAGVVLLIAGCAIAQTGTPERETTDPLRGPSVQERATPSRATLIERDSDGRIRRLELDPALAALEKVALDKQTRERADKIVVARLTVLDRIVQDNFIAIAELAQAHQAGDKKPARKLLADLYTKARPYLDRGPLLEELRPALPADTHARLKIMVDEYTNACIDERMLGPDEHGKKPARIGAVFAENLHVLGQEVRRSYQRTVQAGGGELDQLIKDLGLTPEQEAKIRTRITDAYLDSQGKPSRVQQARVFLESYQDLNTEQRQRLVRIVNQKRAQERPSPAAQAPEKRPGGDAPEARDKNGTNPKP